MASSRMNASKQQQRGRGYVNHPMAVSSILPRVAGQQLRLA